MCLSHEGVQTIILHNLYGVDIMHEATEIAKLRLFLKMVAVVDVDFTADNLGLDPLPDIDFNIRCGNTLVGYATEKQLDIDLQYGDMFANLEFKEKIDTEMQKVAKTFDRFRQLQLSQDAENMQAFKEAKQELNDRLAQLNDLLNRRLYTSTTGNILAKGEEKYNALSDEAKAALKAKQDAKAEKQRVYDEKVASEFRKMREATWSIRKENVPTENLDLQA